jgi:hypothetical protein
MNVRYVGIWTALVLVAPDARANEQTPSVKETPLAHVRRQLTHYDLEPQGTVALLPQLAEVARTLRGTPAAAEAAFLRAAAANDLLFLADYFGNDALRAGLATEFGVAPEAVAAAIARELAARAQGVYREPAQLALAALQRTEPAEQVPAGASDLRRDARFLRAATLLVKEELVGARFAALAGDPCARSGSGAGSGAGSEQGACPAPYSDFDADGRRAFAYLQQLSAAAARLERGRGVGDPLSDALAVAVDRDIALLRAFTLRLTPRIAGDVHLMPQGAAAWPAPHVIVFVHATVLQYARAPRARIGTAGEVGRVPDSAPVFPATAAFPQNPTDTSSPTKSIDDFVTAMRTVRGDEPAFRALLVADAGISSQLATRALVSLRKAGAQSLLVAAYTQDGALLGLPIRVVLPGVDALDAPDLKLRVRLGGYSLDVGRGPREIARVRDGSGLRFDVAALRAQAAARAPRSAAVSFMPDVAVEQLLLAMLQVTPSRTPIDLVIQ